MFLGKGVLKICSKFTGEHPCRSAISIKLQGNHTSAWVFSVNLLHIFRTPFLKGIAMQTEKALINDRLRVLKVS